MTRRAPVVFLLAAWVVVFAAQSLSSGRLTWWIAINGGLPVVSVVTAAFGHVGTGHLAVNAFLIWTVGVPVASRWGPWRFWMAAAVGQLAGVLTHLVAGPSPERMMLGGSFIVSAMAGVFMTLPERPRRSGLVVGALVSLEALQVRVDDGVTHAGHLGAFAAGLMVGWLLVRRRA